MNKRTLAVLAGTILLQTAAFAADSTETQSKDSTSVECQKSKCEKLQSSKEEQSIKGQRRCSQICCFS